MSLPMMAMAGNEPSTNRVKDYATMKLNEFLDKHSQGCDRVSAILSHASHLQEIQRTDAGYITAVSVVRS